jgi:hemerythrin-like domain-containing protein
MKEKTAISVQKRRELLQGLASTAGLAVVACATAGTARGGEASAPQHEKKGEPEEALVTPGEDLMQEHGVLERILLIYDEAARRIEHTEELDLTSVTSSAGIVRRFVEEYHEKNEEKFVFPRLRTARREVELVDVLLRQHQRGRELTDDILRKAAAGASPELAQALRNFARMYRPHAAREETVLFPAFRDVVGRKGYEELGEQFEDEEHERFGEHGFENTVAEVAKIEAALGIADLAKFTPP